MKHVHEFSVDTSCHCGIMLSEYTRELQKQNDSMLDALKAVHQYWSEGNFARVDRIWNTVKAAIALTNTPKCFKCQRTMSLIQAINGRFWCCDGPHHDGQWQSFKA